jgi:phage tail tape-measure protein
VFGQFLGEPVNRRCARAKAFSTGLLPRGSVSPGMCVGGVAERYAKGLHSGCRSRPKGDGSSGARGSTAGTGVWVRMGRVPIVGGNAMTGGSLAWNRLGVNARCGCLLFFFSWSGRCTTLL